MTALFFVPPTADARPARRVDLAHLARLFAEPDEAPKPKNDRSQVARIVMMVLILLGAIGDTVLVTKTEALSSCAATNPHAIGLISHPVSF
jgi:hypothetical protein